ncbi:S8 family serine peptidase, partial [Avibacterium paragallinarum]
MVDENKRKDSNTVIIFELSKQAGLQSIEDASKFVRNQLDEALKRSTELDKLLTKPYSVKLFLVEKGAKYVDPIYKIAVSFESRDPNRIAKTITAQLSALQFGAYGATIGAGLGYGVSALIPQLKAPVVNKIVPWGLGVVFSYAGSNFGENLVNYLWDIDTNNGISSYTSDKMNITVFRDGNNIDVQNFSSKTYIPPKPSLNVKFMPAPFTYGYHMTAEEMKKHYEIPTKNDFKVSLSNPLEKTADGKYKYDPVYKNHGWGLWSDSHALNFDHGEKGSVDNTF